MTVSDRCVVCGLPTTSGKRALYQGGYVHSTGLCWGGRTDTAGSVRAVTKRAAQPPEENPEPYGTAVWWLWRARHAPVKGRKAVSGRYCCPFTAGLGPDTGRCDHQTWRVDELHVALGLGDLGLAKGTRERAGKGMKKLVRM